MKRERTSKQQYNTEGGKKFNQTPPPHPLPSKSKQTYKKVKLFILLLHFLDMFFSVRKKNYIFHFVSCLHFYAKSFVCVLGVHFYFRCIRFVCHAER